MRRLHLAAESGCVRMERRADTKETCLLLVEMTLIIMLVKMGLSTIMNHDCKRQISRRPACSCSR